MKKFLGILAAVMVAVISVFNLSGNIKNTAEPQYFRNNYVQNAIVETNTNTYEFYLSTPESFDYTSINIFNQVQLPNYEFYYFNENKEKRIIQISDYLDETTAISFRFENDELNCFHLSNTSHSVYIFMYNQNLNYWTLDQTNNIKILGFGFNIGEPITNLNEKNEELIPYIGSLTSLETEEEPTEPTVPLTQIGSIITDTIGWFTNIFTGLSAAFYMDGALTTWGTVLFIGVAITLIAMCLKWLISLIKGV